MPVNGKRITARLLKEMTVLFVSACAFGAAVNLLHPRGFVLVSRPEIDERSIVAISVDEARVKRDAGALFVDARERAEYEYARIPGAVSVPLLDLLEPKGAGPDLSFLDRRDEVVIYCESAACGASRTLAKLFRERGYGRVLYIMEKGFTEWRSQGCPVERGE